LSQILKWSQLKFGPKCGYLNDDNAAFCINCGAQLPKTTTVSAPQGPSSTNIYITSPTATPRTNGFAVASFVIGLIAISLAIAFWYWWYLGLLLGIMALIFGLVGQSQIKSSNGNQTGYGLAIAGLVLGIISIAIPILALAACAACISSLH